MPLTVADILRWDAESVREVFHAATARATATFDASDGLGRLPIVFGNWGGQAAIAANHTLRKTRADLDAHGNQVAAVAKAAGAAADKIEDVQRQLKQLIDEAHRLDMEVNHQTNTVVPGPKFSGNPMELLLKQNELQPELTAIVAEANAVDAQLATAIDMADGDLPITPPNKGTVRPVDNKYKTDKPTPEPKPNPKDPHPTDPDRSRDGTYGPGNSGSGKAAEKEALDERERKTHIPIVRDQVRATHPDRKGPSGKPQHRLYDGLEPTGRPNEYIGIEAKTHEGVDRTRAQKEFDAALSRDRPATATLHGRTIKIVGFDLAYPPEGWEPPPAEADWGPPAPTAQPSLGPTPATVVPASEPGLRIGTRKDAFPGAGPPFFIPDYGTGLTPQQMIDSGDPWLRLVGEGIRQKMLEKGIIDSSGIA